MTAATPEGGEGPGGGAGGGGGGRRGDEFDRLGVGGDLSGPAIAQRHEQAQALVQDLRGIGEVLTDPHVMLDVAGTFPGIGRAADAFNASLYAVKGNWAAAGLHAVGAVPIVGESRRVARVAKNVRTANPSARTFADRLADFRQNPGRWKTESIHAEPGTSRRAIGGSSEQIIYRNTETGETLVRHRVTNCQGKVIDDHFRPGYKPRVNEVDP